MSDSSDDYATPKWLLALISPSGDHFDPCPLYGIGGQWDGLTVEWPTDRLVYINPPFSDPLPWVRRAAEHPGPVTLLLQVDPTTKWWTYSTGFDIILIGSRLHFSESVKYARQTLCIWRKGAVAVDPSNATAERRGAERALRWAWDEIGGGDCTDTADDNRDCFAREGLAALFPATTVEMR